MSEEDKKTKNWFIRLILVCCVVAIGSSFYFFYFKKDYDFNVETKCDPHTQTCFYRDCSLEGNCPPNNLSYYKQYTIKARDFAQCKNEDCTDICMSGGIQCIETQCTDQDKVDKICVDPNATSQNINNTTATQQ